MSYRVVRFGIVGCIASAALAAGATAQVIGVPQVVCVGTECGGNGGQNECSSSEFCYRVKPNGNSISWLEVGVEDGDIANYGNLCAPTSWTMSIVEVARSHDAPPTSHGSTTGKAGTCPYVLRFSGPAQSSNFEVGYSYDAVMNGHHDVNWKTSNGTQSGWTFPVGSNSGPVHSPSLADTNTNVLIIVLDDVGTDKVEIFDDAGGSGPYARTPTIDALATGGILFRNFYVNPVCSTTRACLQTGRYAFRHGIGALSAPDGMDGCEVTLAELLDDGLPAGQFFASGAFGKWHLAPDLQANWPHAGDNGYERFYGHLTNSGGHFDWDKIKHDPPAAATEVSYSCYDLSCAEEDWIGNVVRADAVSWIDAQARPFLAYVAFNPPHYPLQVPPFETEDARPLLSQDTLDELDLLGLSVGGGVGSDPEKWKLVYLALLEAIDSEIGYLLDDIEDRLDDTMVFVLCDNGTEPELIYDPYDPDHGKDSVYQLGVRVPLVVSGPLVTDPGEATALVGAVDVFSTVADIVGANEATALAGGCESDLDSVSFLPVILDPDDPGDREYAFSQLFTPNGSYRDAEDHGNHLRAITDGRYKYVRRLIGHDNGEPIEPDEYLHEFYDLLNDPTEEDDLVELGMSGPEELVYDAMVAEMDALSEF